MLTRISVCGVSSERGTGSINHRRFKIKLSSGTDAGPGARQPGSYMHNRSAAARLPATLEGAPHARLSPSSTLSPNLYSPPPLLPTCPFHCNCLSVPITNLQTLFREHPSHAVVSQHYPQPPTNLIFHLLPRTHLSPSRLLRFHSLLSVPLLFKVNSEEM
ncbi:hypothetical protein NQZ68_023154 [Dissostichus eleginoides]|nr:hypothetical protein NQZ68_023154 [Dissostichus eleginoides]